MTQSEQERTFYFRGKTKMYLNTNRFVKAPPPLLLPALTGIGVAKDFARSRGSYTNSLHIFMIVMLIISW